LGTSSPAPVPLKSEGKRQNDSANDLSGAACRIAVIIAATQGVSYLLTWNSAHIANAEKRPLVEAVCRVAGYEAPILCTPVELMGEDSYVDAR
jgi:hypothetical protein